MALAATALLQINLRGDDPQPDVHLQKARRKDERHADFSIHGHLETPDLVQRENEYDDIGNDIERCGVNNVGAPDAMPRDPFVPTPLSGGALFHSKGEFDYVEHEIGHHQPDNRPKHELTGSSIGHKNAEHLN